jgi:hypothetical protein
MTDHSAHDTLWQVIGMAALIAPVLILSLWLAIASRRRQAAERAETSTS